MSSALRETVTTWTTTSPIPLVRPPATTSAAATYGLAPAHSSGVMAATHPGLVLSPAAEPLPNKLVEKMRAGHFIEMKELLADNIALINHLESVQGSPSFMGAMRPRLREVSSLPTWCYCFMGYMAVRTSDPTTRDQLAYARLIIREAHRHGGSGWLDYDRAFRQQAAIDPGVRWNTLNPGLQAATMLGQRASQGTFCTLCRGVDHPRAQCALSCLQPQNVPTAAPSGPSRRRQGASQNVCISWNQGDCVFPGQCRYLHTCATCQLAHKAKDCPRMPDTSIYKLRQRQRPPIRWTALIVTMNCYT